MVFIGIFLSLNFFLIQILAFIVRQILVFLIQFQVFLQIQVFLRIQVFLIQIQAFPIQIQVFLIQIQAFLVLILVFLILVLNFQFLVFQLLEQIFLPPYRILSFIQNLVYLNQVSLNQIQAFLMLAYLYLVFFDLSQVFQFQKLSSVHNRYLPHNLVFLLQTPFLGFFLIMIFHNFHFLIYQN